MKKLFFFLFASMLLCSCSCLLSQIPPQYIYAGSGCTSSIPDYKTQVTVTGGCTGFTLLQTPASGTLLTATNKTANVIIKATGANGKSSQIQFTVTMLDTITPKIVPTGTLAAYRINQLNEVYNAGDKIAAGLKSVFPYSNFPGSNVIDSSLKNNVLVIVSKNNNRIMTYSNQVDVSMTVNKTK